MTDPFDALREPVVPLAPRPEFARALRQRIAAELGPDTEGTTMTTHTLAIREYTPARLHSLTPYLATSDPAAAIAWYTDVFDAVLTPGDVILLLSWRDPATAEAFRRQLRMPDGTRVRRVRVVRDYGMFDRREAPQYYPEVRR